MSGERRVVDLPGTSMAEIVSAIPIARDATGGGAVIVGGLAVVCRLSTPYRATTDLDTAARREKDAVSHLELLRSAGAFPSGPSGVLLQTPLGPVQVDVLEVSDADLDPLPIDPTDRLHVLAHAWAVVTATPVTLRAEGVEPVSAPMAAPAALVAMKLQSVMNRPRAKEGTDLLDIVRLTTDAVLTEELLDDLAGADAQLREDALVHVERWFFSIAPRSLARMRAVPEGNDINESDVALVGSLLREALR